MASPPDGAGGDPAPGGPAPGGPAPGGPGPRGPGPGGDGPPLGDDRAGAVFDALADPMRRRLLAQIAEQPSTATELAGDLPITRQAVAKHLSSLAQAGLLRRERAGRDVRYRVTPAPLSDAVSWMAHVGGQWDERLARLERSLRG